MQIHSRSASLHGFNHHLTSGGLRPHVTFRPVGDLALECRDKGTDWRITLTTEDITAVIGCALSDYAFRAQIVERFKHQKSSPFEIVERRAPEPSPQARPRVETWPIAQPERRAPIEHWPIRQPERRAHIEHRPIEPDKGSLLPKMPVPDHCRRDDQTVKPTVAEFA
jgi:hypothetical protein